ncbi:membrane-spanning 4-domains subfamily A member 6D [Nannospalax galili]|uniref:membrane-spanning 4-domains subfamily A member 6D n=1 Tax=Nannospalax galili TaxID=1026970 RepID=UPI00111C3260|nr:membrane-spanning 4-domains subfamily A member 6D [Nannospalax galili]
MISQIMTNEDVTVITSNGIIFPQASKPQPTHQSQDSLKKSLKAEVKVMATIQIMCGVMVFCLGIVLASAFMAPHFTSVYSILLKSTYPFLGALCKRQRELLQQPGKRYKDTCCSFQVRSSLALSILSIPFALLGIIILSIILNKLEAALHQCELSKVFTPTENIYSYYREPRDTGCLPAKGVLTGAMSVMLIGSVLELGLAVLTAVLWWKQAHSDFPGNVIFLPQGSRDKPDVFSKTPASSAYEELLIP